MANENNRIAIEKYAKRIGGERAFVPVTNLCCTKARSEIAGCSTKTSYQQKQLVKKIDLFRENDYQFYWPNKKLYLEMTAEHPYQVLNMYMSLGNNYTSPTENFILTPMMRENMQISRGTYTFDINFNNILGSKSGVKQAEWILKLKNTPSDLDISNTTFLLVACSSFSSDLKNRYIESGEQTFKFNYIDIYNNYIENVSVVKYDNIKDGTTITITTEF